MKPFRLFAFAASSREGSFNQTLLNAACAHLPDNVTIDREEDYRQLTLPAYEDAPCDKGEIPADAQRIAERFTQADGFMIAAPEYNWSMPGSLKNTIDWVSRIAPGALQHKAALLLCASPSVRGGVVGLTQLRVPLEVLGCWVYPQLVTIGESYNAFDENGQIKAEKNNLFVQECVTDFAARANILRAT